MRLHRRTRRRLKMAGNALLGVGIAVVGLVVATAVQGQAPPPVSATVASAYASKTALPTRAPFVQVTYAKVKPALLDASKPFTIAVLGDSTGNEPGEWVDLAMRRIAAQTGRPLVMNTWELAANAYGPAQTIVPGAGKPLTVWNGSASGKSGLYAAEYYSALVPKVADLAIINHGHNITVATTTETQISGLIQKIRLQSGGKTAIALTLQNPESGPNRERNEQVVATIRSMVHADKGLHGIDAHAAFTANGDLAAMLRPDGLHPSEKGSAIWADSVTASLGF